MKKKKKTRADTAARFFIPWNLSNGKYVWWKWNDITCKILSRYLFLVFFLLLLHGFRDSLSKSKQKLRLWNDFENKWPDLIYWSFRLIFYAQKNKFISSCNLFWFFWLREKYYYYLGQFFFLNWQGKKSA